jgi:hypothetical protein
MKSRATRRFWECYNRLPAHIQKLAVKNFRLWQADSSHPSLAFRPLRHDSSRFSVRVGDHYRALAQRTDEGVTWVWIGTHEEYNRLVGG